MKDDMQLVTVATFNQLAEAYLAKNLLEAQGIPVFLADEGSASWHVGTVIPGAAAKLQVSEEHEIRAAQILQEAKDSR